MKLEWEIALLMALDMLETFSRNDAGLVLMGIRKTNTGRELDRLLERWRREQMVARTGRGRGARYRIKDSMRNRMQEADPSVEWGRHWDGKWRVFCFDLPAARRQVRVSLWRHLCAARFGFLQRSVWISPHDAEAPLREMVEAKGIPECFCGFEVSRLFLCETTEIVGTAWNWKRINSDQDAYLQQAKARLQAVRISKGLGPLARITAAEKDAYAEAFRRDPLLPRALWPAAYRGPAVRELHLKVLAGLRDRVNRAGCAQ